MNALDKAEKELAKHGSKDCTYKQFQVKAEKFLLETLETRGRSYVDQFIHGSLWLAAKRLQDRGIVKEPIEGSHVFELV
jgi:hypothetical protein